MSVPPITYLISPGELTELNYRSDRQKLLDTIQEAVSCNISLIQIREKNLPATYLIDLTQAALNLTKGSNTKILVNERADIADVTGAAGVHLRSDSMSVSSVKRAFPDLMTIVSCHSTEELATAHADKADMATFGPFFDSPYKGTGLELQTLQHAAASLPALPIIALGGIDLNNYKQVLRCGAAGFAAIRSLNNIDNLRRLKSELKR